jgi:hypothetical protein
MSKSRRHVATLNDQYDAELQDTELLSTAHSR